MNFFGEKPIIEESEYLEIIKSLFDEKAMQLFNSYYPKYKMDVWRDGDTRIICWLKNRTTHDAEAQFDISFYERFYHVDVYCDDEAPPYEIDVIFEGPLLR